MTSAKSASEIADWCAEYLSIVMDLSPDKIDRGARFSRLGVDSAIVVSLLTGLEELLSTEIDPEITIEYKTINGLAGHLATRQRLTE